MKCTKCDYEISTRVQTYCENLVMANQLPIGVYLCCECQIESNRNTFTVYQKFDGVDTEDGTGFDIDAIETRLYYESTQEIEDDERNRGWRD